MLVETSFNAIENCESVWSQVHVLKLKLDPRFCQYLITSAEATVMIKGQWNKTRHEKYPTTDIDVLNDFSAQQQFSIIMIAREIANVAKQIYNIPESIGLDVNDLFICKYDINDQRTLEKHFDGKSILSFVIKLNDEFEGSGTSFDNCIVRDINIGQIILFAGSMLEHEALEITAGTRYILTGFIQLSSEQSGLNAFLNMKSSQCRDEVVTPFHEKNYEEYRTQLSRFNEILDEKIVSVQNKVYENNYLIAS